MNEKIVEEAGLTRIEAKIYIALLEHGSALAGQITRISGVHRRTVYDAIERLIEKGLVSYIVQNNRKYFEAVKPERLLELLEERKQNIAGLLPELQLRYNETEERKETTFFKGKLGVKSVFEDMLRAKEILILGATTSNEDIIKYYFPHFDKKRLQKKIKLRMIFSESAKKRLKKYELCKVRFLPKQYETPTTIEIYENKVAIILWAEEPIAILINQKEISDSYKKYFELMWSIAKE